MKNLITYLKTLWGAWGNLQSKDISLDRRFTVGSPSGLDAKWKQNPFMRFAVVLTLIFTIGIGNAWGEHTVVKAGDMVSGKKYIIAAGTDYYLIPNSYAEGASGSLGTYSSDLTETAAWTFTKSGSVWYISTVVNKNTVYLGHNSKNNGVRTNASSQNYTISATSSGASTVYLVANSRYLSCTPSNSNWRCYTGTGTGTVALTLYEVSASSCSTDPTVGASSNSSISCATATVSCTGITIGDCDIDEWGFYYKTGSSGVTKDDTKVQVSDGKSTTSVAAFNKAMTGLAPNTHYYFKAYARVGTDVFLGSETDFTTKNLTASSNNGSYGTVSATGMTITGSPSSGYVYASPAYTVTAGNGITTVEQSGNTFTVTTTSTINVAITINFEAKNCTDHGGTNVMSESGSSNAYGPIAPYYNYSTRQILYTKTDLDLGSTKKGTIKSIYFKYAYGTAMTAKTNVKIYMANTYLTALAKGSCVPYSEFTEVYSGALNCSINGWNEITLNTPFEYNGAGNLVVMIDDNSGAFDGSSYVFRYHTANTTTGSQIYNNSDSNNDDPSTTDWSTGYTATNYRPTTKFCIEEKTMEQYTVNWYVNGEIEHTQTNYEGTALTGIPTPDESDCDGSKVFVGWCTTSGYSHSSVAPEFVSPTKIGGANANYYAVFANRSGSAPEAHNGPSYARTSSDDYTSGYTFNTTNVGSSTGYRAESGSNGSTSVLKLYHTSTPVFSSTPASITVTAKIGGGSGSQSLTNAVYAQLVDNSGNDVGTAVAITDYITSSSGDTYSDITIPTAGVTSAYGLKLYHVKQSGFNVRFMSFSMKYSTGGYTYSNYSTNCCTKLGSVSGAIGTNAATSVTLTWSAVSGAEKYQVKVPGSSSHNDWTDAVSGVSVTKSCGTAYTAYFRAIDTNGSHCSEGPESTLAIPAVSWTVTKTGVTNVTAASLSAIPATTCASGFGPITIEAASGYVLPATITVTGATGSWTQASGSLTISSVTGNVSITITPTAASCASFSFHTGTGEDATVKTTNTTTCFSQVNSSTTWKIDNYVIPADTKFFVGDRGFFYDDNLGSNNSRSAVKTWSQEMFFEYTKAYGDGYRPTVGQATGAIGTLYIWSDNNWNNLHVGFSPQGYVFKLGSANLAMSGSATLDADRYLETSVITLTSTDISGNYQTNLYTGSAGGVASNNTQSTAVNTMGVKTNAGDNWRGTAINDGTDANTRGFFRIDIGDGGTKNWHAHWVPTHRVIFHSNYPGGGGEDQYSVDVSVEETNSSIALASAPSAPTGYTFAGWYDAADGGNHITTARTISAGASANVELWAHWTANTISLTLNKNTEDAGSNNGSGSIDFDATSGTISTAPTRTGYTVEGYYTDDACTAANKVLTNTGAVVNSTVSGYTTSGKWTRATTPTTLYTKWTPNNYTVTWHVGDATSTSTVAYNTEFQDISVGKPSVNNNSLSTCESNYFVGWVTSGGIRTTDGGTVSLYNDNKVNATDKITGDVDFYAMFATSSGGGSPSYKKVTSTSNITNDGRYLIVEETDGVVFNGGLSTIDATNNVIAATFTAGVLAIKDGNRDNLAAAEFSIDMTNLYVKNKDNKYIYQDSYGNGLPNTTTPTALHSISIDGDEDFIVEGNGQNSNSPYDYAVLRFNNNTGSGNWRFRFYKGTQQKIQLYKYDPGTTYSNYRTNCAACANTVTVSYNAAPTGGTVAVEKGGIAIANNGTVKTCDGSVNLTVTITPASHFTLTGLTAQISSTDMSQSHVGNVYTVTIPQNQTGTLVLTPNLTEDAHVAINWNVNGVNQSIAATEGLTWVYSGGDLTALPSEPSVPAGCSGTKVFAGWSTKHSDATEEDASYYDDLFTAVGDAPTGISSAKTFYAVFATSSANPLAGEVMWDEPWTGTSDKTTPTSPSSGATVYNSTVLTYAYTDGNTTTQVYADGTMYSGGAAAPELLISKTSPSGVWTVTNIPTGGSAQTELTLSYKTNKTTIAVTSGTSGITIGDATVDGNTYTHTITISHSPSTINNFSLIFTNTGSANARLDDIHLVVPGSGTMTDYVTLCAPSWTITYDKNTSDPVTNLPSPTSVLQSTGSGTLSSTVPERATYTFSGWAETTSGAVAYAAGGSITGVTGDKTLYAVWTKTPVEELFLNYSELNKYVGDPAVTLEVTGVTPEGADPSVTWSSSNSSVASVVAATGVVTFGTVGTATITATSTVTGTTTAYCYVTVRNKPTASFTDLIHDGNGTDLSTYYMQNVAGTPIVFPTLDDYATPGDDCDSKHYVFVGWTTSDNNDDPQDHLVASGELEDDQDKVFYAVWADGVEGVSYTQLTTSTFKTSPTKYVIGAIDGDETFYFYSCAATDANNGNGGCTNAPGTNAPIQFTLSGTADALVATSTEASARYLTPLTAKNFQMSATSKAIQLNDAGTIANPSDDSWTLRFNTSEDYLRWYSSATGNSAYFYEVTSGAAVSYRTSCCTNNVPAPTVIATNTAYTVTLTWAAVDGATGYEVSWNGGAYEAATSPCVKSGLTASTDYIYKVRATYDPLVKCGALVASGSVTTDDVYSVTYSGGTGTGSCSPSGSVAPASYEAGATVTLAPTNSFSLTSNTFAAWVVKDADDNDVPVSNNQFTMPAKNVTVTATWTAVQDKYYDRMHDGTDASHGGIADGEGKYYLVLEGCNYTVPTLTDDDDGDTECHTTHFKLLGWIAQSHLKTDGSGEIKPGEESYIFQGGGAKSATGATYYAIWAIMTE